MQFARPKVPSFYEPVHGDIVQMRGLKAGTRKSLPVWRPTQQELAMCEVRVDVFKGEELRIACKPSYNCSYDWILDAGEGARHRWLMARNDQIRVVEYAYNDLTGKLVKPAHKNGNLWLAPAQAQASSGYTPYLELPKGYEGLMLCVGYEKRSLANVIFEGELYTATASSLCTTIATPSSVPLV